MRKVLEVLPATHKAVSDAAHEHRTTIMLLSSVLVEYALRNLDRALEEADTLLAEAESREIPREALRLIVDRRPR